MKLRIARKVMCRVLIRIDALSSMGLMAAGGTGFSKMLSGLPRHRQDLAWVRVERWSKRNGRKTWGDRIKERFGR
jgi:hypothetical protein